MRPRHILTRFGIVAAVAAGAILPAAGHAAAEELIEIVILGEWGDSESCNAAADHNNTLGLPGQFACLLFRGQYFGIYVG
jgi:hypothetical protein